MSKKNWKAEDWKAVIVQLMDTHPEACKCDTFKGIKEDDFRAAQQTALSEDKHRTNQINMTETRRSLKKYMDLLKQENPEFFLMDSTMDVAPSWATKIHEPAPVISTPEPEPEPEPVKKSDPALTSMIDNILRQTGQSDIQSRAVNQLLSVSLSSILDTLSENLTEKISDRVVEKLLPYLNKSSTGIHSYEVRKHNPQPSSVDRSKKPKIIIMGTLHTQGKNLQADYSMFDIVTIYSHTPNLKDLLRTCDRAIGITKNMNHGMGSLAKTAAGERYVMVTGGISSIKHLLDVWLACWKNDATFFDRIGSTVKG